MNLSVLFKALANPSRIRAFVQNSRPAFSQFGEDVILRRLLSPGNQGCYVDVGAHHPIEGNNTYYLYTRGWRGLTIDPNPELVGAYARYRPDGTHLVRGVSATPGEWTFYSFAESQLNTFSAERFKALRSRGDRFIGESKVACEPLSALVDQFLPEGPIDVLSVDCEGWDLDAIQSLDLTSERRPSVIIVEDYDRLRDFRLGTDTSQLHAHLGKQGYQPIAQLAFSAIYVAVDWRAMFARSPAFDERRIQASMMP